MNSVNELSYSWGRNESRKRSNSEEQGKENNIVLKGVDVIDESRRCRRKDLAQDEKTISQISYRNILTKSTNREESDTL
jgi:hypothetical protein